MKKSLWGIVWCGASCGAARRRGAECASAGLGQAPALDHEDGAPVYAYGEWGRSVARDNTHMFTVIGVAQFPHLI